MSHPPHVANINAGVAGMTIDQDSMQMVQGTSASGAAGMVPSSGAPGGASYTASTPSTVRLSKIIACEIKVSSQHPAAYACTRRPLLSFLACF